VATLFSTLPQRSNWTIPDASWPSRSTVAFPKPAPSSRHTRKGRYSLFAKRQVSADAELLQAKARSATTDQAWRLFWRKAKSEEQIGKADSGMMSAWKM
jgi:hypothetical protein